MADEIKRDGEQLQMDQAYMDRLFCTTKERIAYVGYKAFGTLSLGKYDVGADIWLYKIFGLEPKKLADATAVLAVYDMINDPLTAAIIDNMRTRWGKFKPFQYLAMLPSILSGIYTCFLPLIAAYFGMTTGQKLIAYMVLQYFNETIGAFFGGGGYIENVFTPNPNERTSLLVGANFVRDLIAKLPSQILGLIYDLIGNGKLKVSMTKVFITFKTVTWIIAIVPTIFWYLVSKERVPQSEKPPHPVKGILSVFKNRPLLIYTLSGLIGGIDVGSGEDLYYNDVLKFNMLPTVAGIPGMPVSYASYALAPKFRERFSTKMLWYFSNGSIFISEALFFFTGLIGGEKKGFYQKKLPMSIAFGMGNLLEMVFYATKGIVGQEINYEVLDYCEWKNGFRVEATINLINGYFTKIKDAILRIVNAHLLQDWAKYEIGETAIQTQETKWRLFLIAFGPHLIFDFLALLPMLFYNLDKETRERMYMDLEQLRARRAAMEKELQDQKEA